MKAESDRELPASLRRLSGRSNADRRRPGNMARQTRSLANFCQAD